MTNQIIEAVEGVIGGLVAGISGYTIDLSIGATFTAFGTLIPGLIVLALLYSVISFVLGIKNAIMAGAFFSFGIILAGIVFGDFNTVIGGLISSFGLLLGIIRK